MNLYERVGGEDFFFALVDRFYAGVADDPLLRPMYPDDLTDSRKHLAMFLIQYWGGPGTYSEERGHPRLRMRHVGFSIGEIEADRWFCLMEAAVGEANLPEADEREMLDYFAMAASSLINHDRLPDS